MFQKRRFCNRRKDEEGLESLILGIFVWLCIICRAISLSSDGIALLELKRSIDKDPAKLLGNWNEADETPCFWSGVSCDPSSNRVVALSIRGQSNCTSLSLLGPGSNSSTNSRVFSPCSDFIISGFSPGKFLYNCFSEWLIGEKGSANSSVNRTQNCNGLDAASCKLTGMLSPFVANLTELRILSLPFNGFSGNIPKELGELKFLQVLELQGNSFSGNLPAELGQLRALGILNLAYNSLTRSVPKRLSNCVNIEVLDLSGNGLNGTLPSFFGGFPKLKILSVSFNQFTGRIPEELGANCGSLEHLHLAGNLLTESIPPNLGNCLQLKSLLLFSNFLEQSIPSEFGKLSNLEILDVSRNCLSGKIPPELANAQSLTVLLLSDRLNIFPRNATVDPSSEFSESDKGEYSYFEGEIPSGLFNHPRLQILWAPGATLNGPLPLDWINCSSLQVVNLGGNFLSGSIPPGLAKCKNLFFLDLSYSNLTGEIPQDLDVSSMLYFNVSGNSLTGSYPKVSSADCSKKAVLPINPGSSVADIYPSFLYAAFLHCASCASSAFSYVVSEGLPVIHDLSHNNFMGSVPPSPICEGFLPEQLSYVLILNRNSFSGNITRIFSTLCPKLQAFVVNVSGNKLSGDISPRLFVECKALKHFEAAANHITGPLPANVASLKSLMYVDLSTNEMSGNIPAEFGQLVDLQYLLLKGNKFSGQIPSELGNLSSMVVLDLSSNALTGTIPGSLVKLKRLKKLFLNNNFLSGSIPEGFGSLGGLTIFNVSYNNLTGELPKTVNRLACDNFAGNHFTHACFSRVSSQEEQQESSDSSVLAYSSPPTVHSENKHKQFNSIEIASITSASAIVFVVIVLLLLYHCSKWRMPSYTIYQSGRKEVITFTNIGVQITYEKIVRATGNFSAANFIGNGGFGATYKAELVPGLLVAVKRLALGRFQGVQQFDAEIRTLGRVRHPNLVTLIGYHASRSEMFLIYNYLPGGNLENFLQERSKRRVDWDVLHKIAFDIARALTYLHYDCVPRVLHRDIKPSNILLDNNCNAYLSDFGLARLLGTSETHATTDVAGTFGYVAPEYAMTCRVSDKADVYSYGIVLLELLSDKKVLDPSFSCYGNGFNIVAWACMLLKHGRAREFFAPGLWDSGPHDNLVDTLHLAVMCTAEALSNRPTMKLVAQKLKHIQPPSPH